MKLSRVMNPDSSEIMDKISRWTAWMLKGEQGPFSGEDSDDTFSMYFTMRRAYLSPVPGDLGSVMI